MTICYNDSIYLQNAWQNTTGIYYDTLISSNGCDSIIETDLMVIQGTPLFSETFSGPDTLGWDGTGQDNIWYTVAVSEANDINIWKGWDCQ